MMKASDLADQGRIDDSISKFNGAFGGMGSLGDVQLDPVWNDIFLRKMIQLLSIYSYNESYIFI